MIFPTDRKEGMGGRGEVSGEGQLELQWEESAMSIFGEGHRGGSQGGVSEKGHREV